MLKVRGTIFILIPAILLRVNLYANKSDVVITAPDSAVRENGVSTRINVTH